MIKAHHGKSHQSQRSLLPQLSFRRTLSSGKCCQQDEDVATTTPTEASTAGQSVASDNKLGADSASGGAANSVNGLPDWETPTLIVPPLTTNKTKTTPKTCGSSNVEEQSLSTASSSQQHNGRSGHGAAEGQSRKKTTSSDPLPPRAVSTTANNIPAPQTHRHHHLHQAKRDSHQYPRAGSGRDTHIYSGRGSSGGGSGAVVPPRGGGMNHDSNRYYQHRHDDLNDMIVLCNGSMTSLGEITYDDALDSSLHGSSSGLYNAYFERRQQQQILSPTKYNHSSANAPRVSPGYGRSKSVNSYAIANQDQGLKQSYSNAVPPPPPFSSSRFNDQQHHNSEKPPSRPPRALSENDMEPYSPKGRHASSSFSAEAEAFDRLKHQHSHENDGFSSTREGEDGYGRVAPAIGQRFVWKRAPNNRWYKAPITAEDDNGGMVFLQQVKENEVYTYCDEPDQGQHHMHHWRGSMSHQHDDEHSCSSHPSRRGRQPPPVETEAERLERLEQEMLEEAMERSLQETNSVVSFRQSELEQEVDMLRLAMERSMQDITEDYHESEPANHKTMNNHRSVLSYESSFTASTIRDSCHYGNSFASPRGRPFEKETFVRIGDKSEWDEYDRKPSPRKGDVRRGKSFDDKAMSHQNWNQEQSARNGVSHSYSFDSRPTQTNPRMENARSSHERQQSMQANGSDHTAQYSNDSEDTGKFIWTRGPNNRWLKVPLDDLPPLAPQLDSHNAAEGDTFERAVAMRLHLMEQQWMEEAMERSLEDQRMRR